MSVLSLFLTNLKGSFGYELPDSNYFETSGIRMGKTWKKGAVGDYVTCTWVVDKNPDTIQALKNRSQKLKVLKHPNILAYLDSLEISDSYYLITELTRPLSLYFRESDFSDAHKESIACWGLFQLFNGLKFLHNEAKLSHERIRTAVYVTEGGDWKISDLDSSKPFTNACKDLNGAAHILYDIFNGFNKGIDFPNNPGKLPKRLHDFFKKCISPGAAALNVADLLKEHRRNGGLFKNRFIDVLLFLEELQLKDDKRRLSFYASLKEELSLFPETVAKFKILPSLIQAYEYGDPGSQVMMPLLRIGMTLREDEYQKFIVPCICKLFDSPDRVTRVNLLDKIDEIAPHLTPQIVNDKIYGNLATGFLDTNPAVREKTVKAMVPLADKLDYNNLNTDLMKYLARLQGSDDQPGIRTNATICLGKIGCYLDPSQRQKILISAFTRAMKDPFPPSRIAAILALCASQQYYSLVEVANRILPALTPLACDSEKQVRDQCFKALKGFIEKLEKASEHPEMLPELEAEVERGGKSSILNSDKVPQWASWALKSLSGKFYKNTPPPQLGNTEPQGSSSPVPVTSTQRESSVFSSRSSTPSVDKGQQKTCDEFKSDENNSIDGWDDLQDELVQERNDKEEEWESAKEDTSDNKSGWNKDWGNDSSSTMISPEFPSKKPLKTSSLSSQGKQGHGGLKLHSSAKHIADEDDLDFLLGVRREPRSTSAQGKSWSSNKNDVKPSTSCLINKSQGSLSNDFCSWDADGYEWDAVTEKTETKQDISSDWNADWNQISSSSKLQMQNKTTRRVEIAARNEARRKELAAKRSAKAVGAMRLGAGKSS